MHRKTIGILGGSFDPPHLGHVEMAKIVSKFVDEVWIVPCGFRDDKPWISSYDIRHHLCTVAFRDFQICDLERGVPMLPTYTLMKKLESGFSDLSFSFAIGTDLLSSLHTWHHAEELINEVSFLVVHRKGTVITSELSDRYFSRNNFIDLKEEGMSEISSTSVRENIKKLRKTSIGEELKSRISDIIQIDELSELILQYDLYTCGSDLSLI